MISNIITIIIVAIVLISFLYSLIFKLYQKKYYDDAYKPENINLSQISKYPEKHIIQDIKVVASDKQYQEAAALKMISATVHPKENFSIENINFLMGYTYGTSFNCIDKNFIPFLEPIEGARLAAPFMGINMHYYSTHSVKIFLNAIKYYISNGKSVLVQLDIMSFYNKKGFYPHSELLVGYDKKGFFYNETMGKSNDIRKYVKVEKLVASVYKLNSKFKKPWKYGFSIFTAVEKNEEINEVMRRNSNKLIGEKQKNTASGSKAIAEFAKHIKETKKLDNVWVIEALEYSRKDNAKFFEERLNLIEASKLFKLASENYNKILEIIKLNINENRINEISEILLESSELEEKIGRMLQNNYNKGVKFNGQI